MATEGVARALVSLALERVGSGRFDEAIAWDRQALQIRPDSADLHDNLGVALIQTGQVAEAIAQFQEALRLKPDFGPAKANLAKGESGWSVQNVTALAQ